MQSGVIAVASVPRSSSGWLLQSSKVYRPNYSASSGNINAPLVNKILLEQRCCSCQSLLATVHNILQPPPAGVVSSSIVLQVVVEQSSHSIWWRHYMHDMKIGIRSRPYLKQCIFPTTDCILYKFSNAPAISFNDLLVWKTKKKKKKQVQRKSIENAFSICSATRYLWGGFHTCLPCPGFDSQRGNPSEL